MTITTSQDNGNNNAAPEDKTEKPKSAGWSKLKTGGKGTGSRESTPTPTETGGKPGSAGWGKLKGAATNSPVPPSDKPGSTGSKPGSAGSKPGSAGSKPGSAGGGWGKLKSGAVTKPDSTKPAEADVTEKPKSGGWSRLKSAGGTKPAAEESVPAPEPASRPGTGGSGWGKLKGATKRDSVADTKPLVDNGQVPDGKAGLKKGWGKSKELLITKPELKRADSLVVPGSNKRRPSVAPSHTSESEKSIESRRSTEFKFNFSAIDIDALREAAQKEEEEEAEKDYDVRTEPYIQLCIPYLPRWLAAICLIMNVFIPGTGTVLSGFAVFCCGKTRLDSKEDETSSVFCTNCWVGFAQLFTVTFMLVGWFWSLTWGIYMIILAVEHDKEAKKTREEELQAKALAAFNPQMPAWSFGRT